MEMITSNTYEMINSNEHGSERIIFEAPKGFDVPCGSFGTFEEDDWKEDNELLGLLAHFDMDFQPDNGDILRIQQFEGPIHRPSLNDLQILPTSQSS
jgi:hypothetical protein